METIWNRFRDISSRTTVILKNIQIHHILFCLSLTHWGWVTHICVSKLTTIGSDNGLSPSRRQAIIWTNAGILLIGPSGTNFSEILIKIHKYSFKKMHLKMSPGRFRPFCLGLNALAIHLTLTSSHFYHQMILTRTIIEYPHQQQQLQLSLTIFPGQKKLHHLIKSYTWTVTEELLQTISYL